MRTIERNYRKNPHTASFLQTFHSGISSTGRNYRAEMSPVEEPETITTYSFGTVAETDDLLALVPDAPADLRTERQAELMESLVAQITELDGEAGAQARTYTDGMTEHGLWTTGRDGKASAWISRMIAKVEMLQTAARQTAPATPAAEVEISAGRYAVKTDEVRCYSIEFGKAGTRWAGFLFLNRISSDDRFAIKNPAEKARILEAIAADIDAAALLAAMTLRICRGTMKNGMPCGRTLSDTKNPYFSQGYGPECGKNL